jgi:cellulose synthase/poly-beta-1,6-N-acetylglucosamine synthase-like glycosyltransferase
VLGILLFWTIYNALLMFAGIGSKHKPSYKGIHELPKFSLVLPAKDEAAVIARCLDSLLSMDYPMEKMEIVVVAGESNDATKEICNDFSRRSKIVRVLCEGTSSGKPAALNYALPYVTGEIVGVFDADSVPERNVLRRVASYFQDRSVTAVQGKTFSLNAKENMLTRMASMEERLWFEGTIRGREKLGLFVPLTGSCQFVRSCVLKELGGWEESSLAEDVELALKLTGKGYLVKFAPDVCAKQETPSSLNDLIKQRTRWYRGTMEAAFRYGTLLRSLSRKSLDAEVSQVGPFVMILALFSYVIGGVNLLFPPNESLLLVYAGLAAVLIISTLLYVGLSAFVIMKPRKLNLLWFPFLNLYWVILNCIAFKAFVHILLRKPRKWTKTVKKGVVIQK